MNTQSQIRELEFTRTFKASSELVYKCWSDPKHIAQWWGPHHFTNPTCQWEAKPGGKIYIIMRDPDGNEYPMGGIVKEVNPPEKIIFIASVNGPSGKLALEVYNTVTLTEKNGVTTMKLQLRVTTATDEATPMLAGMNAGWTQSLERLESHIDSM